MSSSDRILFLNGDDSFSALNGIAFRNKITISNLVALPRTSCDINPSTFRLKSGTGYNNDLYVDFTTSGLHFKMPSKNMLIRVNQSSLDLTEKIISGFEICCNGIYFNGSDSSNAGRDLSSLEFNEYSYGGIIRLLHCIPKCYYINNVYEITIATGNMAIPGGDLTLDFFQFE